MAKIKLFESCELIRLEEDVNYFIRDFNHENIELQFNSMTVQYSDDTGLDVLYFCMVIIKDCI